MKDFLISGAEDQTVGGDLSLGSLGKVAVYLLASWAAKALETALLMSAVSSPGERVTWPEPEGDSPDVTIFLLFHHILLISFNTSCCYWRGLHPSNDSYLVIMGPTSFFLSHL